MNPYIELKNFFNNHSILSDINGILSWDMSTMMPYKARSQRIKQIKIINEYKKEIFNTIKKKELFKKVDLTKLNSANKVNFHLMKKKYDFFNHIPFESIQKKSYLSIECEGLWRESRKKSDFNIVKNKLSDLVDVIKEQSEILSQKQLISKYDCLLSIYDRSLNRKRLEKIFKDIKDFIDKNLCTIKKNQINFSKIDEKLNENEQFFISKLLMKKLGFDFKRGRIDKSLHPFCGGATNDVRITTRFNDIDSFSCFDALMHETGHGLYEQGLPSRFIHQPIGQAAGMSMHESQSLFIEMQIIKSLAVCKYIEKILIKNLKKNKLVWNSRAIFNSRTKVNEGYIRVDADEVYYPLHIIHRFNIELQLIENNEKIKYLPEIWNDEFYKIFGIKVNSDNDGCLQDIHWYGGDFGYFPTYSIGAFIAAQIKYKIKDYIKDFDYLLENGKFKAVTLWLKNNIHNKGNIYKIDELLEKTTGEKLKTKYFKKHISDRYLKKIN